MKVLGIESSCDETSVAVVTEDRKILSNTTVSQIDEHKAYGGVVPEIAARAHHMRIIQVIDKSLETSGIKLPEVDAVAVTAGPGLIGGLIVGVMTGKAISSVIKKPIIAVNHLEAHALTVRLTEKIEFPYLLLLVSGGHCQILAVKGVGKYDLLGETLDDALGEAFDKTAKMLGLGYPGGPIVEKMALSGNEKRFALPRSMAGREGCDFSFSGLKTAVLREVKQLKTMSEQDIKDISASFQTCATDIVCDRITNAIKIYKKNFDNHKIVIAGGVAANRYIFTRLKTLAHDYGFEVFAPPVNLCTDNGAMIAWAGLERFKLGLVDNLEFEPKARWPLY